ncbi:MAG: phosphatase PAP2 family protein [Methanobacterium sp.]|nr:phosphatase PAP2 family protein [Methanobacterium sp.]
MWNLIVIVNNVDIIIFYFINLNLQYTCLNLFMPFITNIGLYTFWIIICGILALFGGEKGRNVALILLLAIVIGHIFTEALKYIFIRPRPYQVLSGVHQLAVMDNPSFPSGHATQIFMACIILGSKYGYILLFLLLAILVSFSRIYIGVHYPSDVLAGALLGIGISIIVLRFEDNILNLKNRIISFVKIKYGLNKI